MVYALLATIPFLTALVLMVGFKFSSGKSLIISLIVTIVLAVAVWKMEVPTVLAYFVYGALKSLDLLLIISGAILLLNTLKQTGIMQRRSSSLTCSEHSLKARPVTEHPQRSRRLFWSAWDSLPWQPARSR